MRQDTAKGRQSSRVSYETLEGKEKFSHVSQRRACKVLGQIRSTQRYQPHLRDDEEILVKRIIELARANGRYGYPRITGLLQMEGCLTGTLRPC